MKQKPSSCGPVNGVVGRMPQFIDIFFNSNESNRLSILTIEEDCPANRDHLCSYLNVTSGMIGYYNKRGIKLLRIAINDIIETLNDHDKLNEIKKALNECLSAIGNEPNPERSEDARDGRSSESRCSTAGDV